MRLLISTLISTSLLIAAEMAGSLAQPPNQLWVNKYEGHSSFEDRAYDAEFDSQGNFVVTGKAEYGCTSYDYTTIKYNAAGDTLWYAVYDGTGENQEDFPNALCIDNQNNTYVTGSSDDSYQEQIATVAYDVNGNQLWASRYTAAISAGNDVIADSSGNVYVCGYEEVSNDMDLILIKYDQNGNQVWVRTYDNGFYDEGVKMLIDANQNVIITGVSSGSSFQSRDIITMMYDPSGNMVWQHIWGAPLVNNYNDTPVDISLDGTGNIYVCGYSYYTNTSNSDYILLKYDQNGNFLWDQNYDSPFNNSEIAQDFVVDSAGNAYMTGYSIGSGTQWDYATVKFNSNGQQIWAQRQDSTTRNDYARSICLDESTQMLFVTGDMNLGTNGVTDRRNFVTYQYDTSGSIVRTFGYQGPADNFDLPYKITLDASGNIGIAGVASTFQYGYGDMAAVVYDPSGQQQWERLWNGQGFVDDQGLDMVADAGGNTYSCGFSWSNQFTTHNDFVVIKTTPDGLNEWEYVYRGPSEESNDVAHHITIDDNGNVYATGVVDTTLTSQYNDIYTVKLSPTGSVIWEATFSGAAGGNDTPAGIAVDNQGNVYVAATAVNFDTGFDGALISYDQNGNQNWVSYFDMDSMAQGFDALAVANTQEIYCGGFMIPGFGVYTDALLVKFDDAGNILWSTSFDADSTISTDRDLINNLAIDTASNVVVAGQANRNFLVAKYDAAGNLLWSDEYSYTTGSDSVCAITIDPFNNVIAAGKATLSFGSDYVTVKYDENGNLLWDKNYVNSPGSDDVPYDIISDSVGNVYITGFEILNFTTNFNFLTLKYDSAGTFAWELIYSDSLGNSPDFGRRIAMDAAGNIYVMGDANQPCFGNTFINGYRYDITTVKYGSGSGVGLQDPVAADTELLLYPNPASGLLNIRTGNSVEGIGMCDITIYNIEGRMVYRSDRMVAGTIELDVSGIEDGLYLIRIIGKDGRESSGKFLIQH
jgi:uncharacterized delta-60 repeat protein